MKDPFGAVLALIRDDAAVSAIVGGRVSSHVEPTPSVQLIASSATRRPFGQGSGRMQMQLWTGIARCWAADSPTGDIAARQLAGAVSDAVHNHGPVTISGQYVARAYASDIDGPVRDPGTNRPFYDVVLNVHAAAQAIA